jgi:hypothetical protein
MPELLKKIQRHLLMPLISDRIGRAVREESRGRILAGPFRGMKYAPKAICGAINPKLLGSYEKELIPVLGKISALSTDLLIDIGAAEGYYAVGMLYAKFVDRVVAFELIEEGRAMIRAMAEANGVDLAKLQIKSRCTPELLSEELRKCQRPVVIMDVEGYEAFLLDPIRLPELSSAHILVEMDDCCVAGLTEVIVSRMSATHELETIQVAKRGVEDLGSAAARLSWYPVRYQVSALSEFRPLGIHWLWMTPRTDAAA